MIQAMIHDEGNEDTTAAEAVKGTIHEAFEDTKAADVVITIHDGNEETTAAKVVKGTIHEGFEDTKAADVVITTHGGNEDTTAAKVVKGTIHEGNEDTKAADAVKGTIHDGNEDNTAADVAKGTPHFAEADLVPWQVYRPARANGTAAFKQAGREAVQRLTVQPDTAPVSTAAQHAAHRAAVLDEMCRQKQVSEMPDVIRQLEREVAYNKRRRV